MVLVLSEVDERPTVCGDAYHLAARSHAVHKRAGVVRTLAPGGGFEPTTCALTAHCSTN